MWPAVAMNSNLPHFKHGDLLLHLWGWQCDWSIGEFVRSQSSATPHTTIKRCGSLMDVFAR